jgi:hypothetical protein
MKNSRFIGGLVSIHPHDEPDLVLMDAMTADSTYAASFCMFVLGKSQIVAWQIVDNRHRPAEDMCRCHSTLCPGTRALFSGIISHMTLVLVGRSSGPVHLPIQCIRKCNYLKYIL